MHDDARSDAPMTLPKFLAGLMVVIVVVAVWSLVDSASFGETVFRVLLTALVVQVGYFLVVFAMVAVSPRRCGADTKTAGPAENAGTAPVAGNRVSGRPLPER